jgi:hypothetical protein
MRLLYMVNTQSTTLASTMVRCLDHRPARTCVREMELMLIVILIQPVIQWFTSHLRLVLIILAGEHWPCMGCSVYVQQYILIYQKRFC